MANYSELMCEAIDLIVKQRLTQIQYDQTQICTIVDDTRKQQGIYIVSNGSARFEAYGDDTYRLNDSVYVNIPNGDMNEQKFIQGKRTNRNANEPFIYNNPFSTFIDITGNIANARVTTGLIANESVADGDETKVLLIPDREESLTGYTRLALKAKFQTSGLSPYSTNDGQKIVVSGDYGLRLRVSAAVEGAAADDEDAYYDFYLNTQNMTGNPYQFTSWFEQGIVFNLEGIKTVKKIALEFYQKSGSFKIVDDSNRPVDSEPNLKVKEVSIQFGYDTSEFNDEKVMIYTLGSQNYKRPSIQASANDQNSKTINLRWIHRKDNNNFISVAETGPSKLTNYEIHWYRYQLGKASADRYSGVYWTNFGIQKVDADGNISYEPQNNKLGFMSNTFVPDYNLVQEQIKAIIIYNNKPYASNILTFTNDEEIVNKPTLDAIARGSALSIWCDDDTYGNYLIYQLGNRLIDNMQSKKIRTFSLKFNLPNNDETVSSLTEAEKITWYIPAGNTMIVIDDAPEPQDDQYIITYERPQEGEETNITTTLPYRISGYYSQSKNNNTVRCEILRDGVTYTAVKELTFGIQGTSGTDVTLVLDFDNGVSAFTTGSNDAVIVTARLYDYENKEIKNIDEYKIEWYWVGNDEAEPVIGNKYEINSSNIPSSDYRVLKAIIKKWGDGTPLEAYLPVPARSSNEYLYISGPDIIQYNNQGYYESSYRDPIVLYKKNENGSIKELRGKDITIEANTKNAFAPQVLPVQYGKLTGEHILQPLKMFVKDGITNFVYNIKVNNNTVWSQPVFIYQNRYPSQIINDWDGKLIVDENENYVAAAQVIAGTKEDNKFTGVVLGDCTTESDNFLSNKIGLYGFSKGVQSFGFREDGTAFIGKAGIGRIEFDGEKGIIESGIYKDNQNDKRGMRIDLTGSYNNVGELVTAPGITAYDFTLYADGSNYPGRMIKLTTESFTEENGIALQIGSVYTKDNKTVDNRFMVAWDGSIVANKGTFKGTIEAEEGTIGGFDGWTIKKGLIYDATKKVVLASKAADKLDSNFGSWITKAGIYTSYGQIGNWVIGDYNNYSGSLYAQNYNGYTTILNPGYIQTGNIYTQTTIEGGKITNQRLRAQGNYLKLLKTTIDGGVIETDSITATEGKIGGWEIDNVSLYNTDKNLILHSSEGLTLNKTKILGTQIEQFYLTTYKTEDKSTAVYSIELGTEVGCQLGSTKTYIKIERPDVINLQLGPGQLGIGYYEPGTIPGPGLTIGFNSNYELSFTKQLWYQVNSNLFYEYLHTGNIASYLVFQ